LAVGVGPQVLVTSAKIVCAYSHCDITHKKTKSKTSHFFKSQLEDFPHLAGFEQLSSSVSWWVMVV